MVLFVLVAASILVVDKTHAEHLHEPKQLFESLTVRKMHAPPADKTNQQADPECEVCKRMKLEDLFMRECLAGAVSPSKAYDLCDAKVGKPTTYMYMDCANF